MWNEKYRTFSLLFRSHGCTFKSDLVNQYNWKILRLPSLWEKFSSSHNLQEIKLCNFLLIIWVVEYYKYKLMCLGKRVKCCSEGLKYTFFITYNGWTMDVWDIEIIWDMIKTFIVQKNSILMTTCFYK